jgi:hypothetical protein
MPIVRSAWIVVALTLAACAATAAPQRSHQAAPTTPPMNVRGTG